MYTTVLVYCFFFFYGSNETCALRRYYFDVVPVYTVLLSATLLYIICMRFRDKSTWIIGFVVLIAHLVYYNNAFLSFRLFRPASHYNDIGGVVAHTVKIGFCPVQERTSSSQPNSFKSSWPVLGIATKIYLCAKI